MTCDPSLYPPGLVFLDTAYLAPVADAGEMWEMYLRTNAEGEPHIAIKEGLLLIGAVWPIFELPGDVADGLMDVARLSGWGVENSL